jgi:predicted nucleic acid-binding protein
VNLYIETSAWVKLYLVEDGRDKVRAAIDKARVFGSSSIALVEMNAALTRATRGGRLPPQELPKLYAAVDADWQTFAVVPADDSVLVRAVELVRSHGLRGYDAVHLASAMELQSGVGGPVTMLSFDEELNAAAKAEGLALPEPSGTVRPPPHN